MSYKKKFIEYLPPLSLTFSKLIIASKRKRCANNIDNGSVVETKLITVLVPTFSCPVPDPDHN
jgi:hypothetical protein